MDISKIHFLKLGFFLLTFSLPLFTVVNNIILGIIIALIGFKTAFDKTFNWRYPFTIVITCFFFIALFASTNFIDFKIFLNDIEKHWVYLLFPLILNGIPDFYRKFKNVIFRGILFGCVTGIFICLLNVAIDVVTYDQPLKYIFRWRHLGHSFTEVIDSHPTYLGLFTVVSLSYMGFNDYPRDKHFRVFLAFLFLLGILFMASRVTVINLCLLGLALTFIRKKDIWPKTLIIYSIIILSVLYGLGSSYLKDRFIDPSSYYQDKRIQRWEVSYKIFVDNPIFGVGFKQAKELRKKEYIKKGDIVASHYNYNSHNQIFEYLVTNGLFGAIFYIAFMLFILYSCITRKDYLFLFTFLFFFISNMTESMLVRIKGIEFFALWATLYLSKFKSIKELFPKIALR